jgi:7-cyano-7-deazaguanine tRNA-ribosyltransferase
MQESEREVFLAEHNLYVCKAEINRIKQAIRDGRLWEHVEMRCHAHPTLLSALKRVKKYQDYIEKFSPASKKSGLFFFSSTGLSRPEVVHYRNRLAARVPTPKNVKILLLVPQTREKPFHKSDELKKIRRIINAMTDSASEKVHICVYTAPFGVIPLELDEIYPLSQHETSLPLDNETINYVAAETSDYIIRSACKQVVLLNDPETWDDAILKKCREASKKKKATFSLVTFRSKESKRVLTRLEKVLTKSLGDQS